MKKYIFIVLVLAMAFPLHVSAHGGVEKTVANTKVTLFQTPLSPFVNEPVDFSFILSNAKTLQRIQNKQLRLEVIKTVTGHEDQDHVVLKKEVTSDVNGVINFSYTFPKTNYYDIELQFGKEGDEASSTGFLVQPRSPTQIPVLVYTVLALSLIANVLLISMWIKKRKEPNH